MIEGKAKGMQASYEVYYDSTVYDSRYPRPNRLTLSRVMKFAAGQKTIVDVGAGNGRYAIPLAAAGHEVIAVERSEVARRQLAERLDDAAVEGSIQIAADLAEVSPELLAKCNRALLLFGVLGHMRSMERVELLDSLQACMAPTVRLAASVPNRLRRFGKEQRDSRIEDSGPAPRFMYERQLDGVVSSFEYTAFTPRELITDMESKGWGITQLKPESLLAEEDVVSGRPSALVDGFVSRFAPSWVGYGLYFEAEPRRR